MPTVEVNGTTLAYDDTGPRDAGDAPTLLMSHSLFFTRAMFDALTRRFEDRCRVVRYDHRGQGESAAAPLERLDMDTLTEDAAALVDTLGLGRVHVLGNSMGGFVALRLAARRPNLVRSAVALGSSAEQEHQLDAFAPVVETLRAEGPGPVLDTLMWIMFGDTSLAAADSPITTGWREYMSGLPRSIGDAAHQVIHRRSVVDELADVRVPVLAIAGAEDHAYPPPISSQHIADATGGRAVVVAGAGHSVALERSDEVGDHLEEHLEKYRAGSD